MVGGAAAGGVLGSEFMMLTGGIDAEDGKSYLEETGVPVGAPATPLVLGTSETGGGEVWPGVGQFAA